MLAIGVGISPIFYKNLDGIMPPNPPFVVAASNSNLITSIVDLDYINSEGPSNTSIAFRIWAIGLTPSSDNITLSLSSSNFEMSDDNGATWQTTNFIIPYTSGGVFTNIVYKVRLKIGLSINTYSGNLIISGGDATNYVIPISGQVMANPDFIITIDTTKPGSSNKTFVFAAYDVASPDYVINWGDGNIETITTIGDPTHIYATSGTYQIRISGDFKGCDFNNTGDCAKLISIDNWGTSLFTNFISAFQGCVNMIGTFTDAPNLSLVNSLKLTFGGCEKFNSDLSNWITSTIISLENTFLGCPLFNGNVTTWDVSNVTNFIATFEGCSIFNQDISIWDVSSGIFFQFMLRQCTLFNQNISIWDVSNGINFAVMLQLCVNFNQPIGIWNMTNAQNVSVMLYGCTLFNQDISDWNIINCGNFGSFMTLKTDSNYNAAYLDAIYNKWSLLTLQPGILIDFGTIKYTSAGSAGKLVLTNPPNNWTIIDGGI